MVQEDEIDLRELFLTLWENKLFIAVFTAVVTLGAIVYALMHNPTPIYEGKVLVEIGEIQSENFGSSNFDHANNLSMVVDNSFNVSSSAPRGTNAILEITASNTDKEKIETTLSNAVDFINQRHKQKAQFYDNYIMSKQVGDITIGNTPTNTPKKKLIVVVAFVTGLILAIFLIFFKEFIKSFKDENSDAHPRTNA